MKPILAVMNDLFFVVKIQDAAKKAGLSVTFLTDEAQVLKHADTKPALVIVDLNYAGVDPIVLVGKLKGAEQTHDIPVIGFVSHVQVDLRARADEAGFNEVFARSAFAQNLPSILVRYFG